MVLEQHQWASLTIYEGYQFVYQEYSDTYWELSYEVGVVSTFRGQVRHTSRINESRFPMLTHDILVTSGDFSDQNIVRTSVSNHRFVWSATKTQPSGTINLLHTMPADEETLNALYDIQYGDTVTIVGYEILEIQRSKGGRSQDKWKDAGCNTLLVTDVIIHPAP
jgi:hypothetical protein